MQLYITQRSAEEMVVFSGVLCKPPEAVLMQKEAKMMARLISNCPRCKKRNKVKHITYLRGDKGTSVTCNRCSLKFCAILSDEDIKELYGDDSIIPIIKGEEDYILKSIFYPKDLI